MRTPVPAAARRLLASGMAVSAGQGSVAVDFALYARALHWSAPFLGGAVGAGMLAGGLLFWWFAARFGIGPGLIGLSIGATLLLASAASLTSGWLGARVGLVNVVVWMRIAGLVLLLLLPFAPSFPLAMVAYAGRNVLTGRGRDSGRRSCSEPCAATGGVSPRT